MQSSNLFCLRPTRRGDYRDYAKLGVGMSLASAFSTGMTQEQQDEINKIVQYYEGEVLDTHSRRISLYDPITAGDGQYYNTYYSIEKCEEVDHVDLEKYGDYWKDWGISDDRVYFATMISDAQALLNSLGANGVDAAV